MNRRKFLMNSAAVVSAGGAILASDGFSRERPECNYRIVYNDDAYTLGRASGLEDLLNKAVNRFVGTQVDALFWSIGVSDIYFFKTKTGERYGQHLKQFKNAGGVQLFEGLQSVLSDREDYVQAMADRSRELGIDFFVSMRMNDCHDSPQGWEYSDTYSQFKKAHPELLLGESVHPSFATGFDFAYAQSRENKFKVIEEIILDYDIDGIELDFLRHPAFFKPDEAYRNRHLITGLVRRVRTLLNKVGKSRGKPIRLAVRVPSSFTIALKLGFDVPVWIEEGLPDVLTAGTPRGHELDLSMDEYIKATRGKKLTLLGQIGLYHPVKQTRATALNYWNQGVNGIYLFNWYAPLNQEDRWRESLIEIGDPDLLKNRDKQYVIETQVGSLWERSHPKAQLPLKIEKLGLGGVARVQFFIGDDFKTAAKEGKAFDAKMVMRFEEVMDDDVLSFKVNGVAHSSQEGEMTYKPTLFGKQFWFHLPLKKNSLRAGTNQLEFVLSKRNPLLSAPLILAEMSVMLDYLEG